MEERGSAIRVAPCFTGWAQRSGQCGLADGLEPLTLLIFEKRIGYPFVKARATELSRPDNGIIRDLGLTAAISPPSVAVVEAVRAVSSVRRKAIGICSH